MEQINTLDSRTYERNHPDTGVYVLVSSVDGAKQSIGLSNFSDYKDFHLSSYEFGFEQVKIFGQSFAANPANILYKLSKNELVDKLESQAEILFEKTKTKDLIGAYWAGNHFLLKELIDIVRDKDTENIDPKNVVRQGPNTGIYVVGDGEFSKYCNTNLSALKLNNRLPAKNVVHFLETSFTKRFGNVKKHDQDGNYGKNKILRGYDASEVPEYALTWIDMNKIITL